MIISAYFGTVVILIAFQGRLSLGFSPPRSSRSDHKEALLSLPKSKFSSVFFEPSHVSSKITSRLFMSSNARETRTAASSTGASTTALHPSSPDTTGATSGNLANGVDDMRENDDSNDSLVPLLGVKQNKQDIMVARLLLIGAAALYGTNFSLVKMLGQSEIPIGLSSALRFGMASLITLPWLIPKKGQDQQAVQEATLAGLQVGFVNSIGYVAQAVGLETTLASKSAFLCSLAVVVVPVIDMLSGKKMENRQIWGTLAALFGVAVLELGGLSANDMAISSGDLASLVQPVAFGIGFWRMEQAMHKHPTMANRCTAAQLLAVALGSLAYCGFTEPSSLQPDNVLHFISDPTILFSLFWTGCITTAMTIYMETLALKTLSAAETTLIFSTEPLWGTAFAAVTLNEHLGMDSAFGAFMILLGCVYASIGMRGMKVFIEKAKRGFVKVAEENEDAIPAGIGFSLAGAFMGIWDEVLLKGRLTGIEIMKLFSDLPDF